MHGKMYTTLRVFLGICFSLSLCVLACADDSLLYENSFSETIPGLEMIKGAPRPKYDNRNLAYGKVIPDEGYCDQPYVVVMPNGNWVVTLTTGEGHEGSSGQHVVAARSTDQGKTWSELIDIEPSTTHKASWVSPMLTPYGRIYAFYTFNTDAVSKLPNGKAFRDDTFGDYCYRYSDDEGRTWSKRYTLPMRITDCDRDNEWGGQKSRVHFWGISKPQIDGNDVFITFTKLRRYFLIDGEGWLFHSDNILTERDPEKIRWTLLPEGEEGIRNPDYPGIPASYGSVQEEHNVVVLNDGKSLYCVYRTTLGFPAQSYSRDRGKTWENPSPMVFTPGGRGVKNPRACAKLWKCENGKYLFWYHNNGTHDFFNRNPAWILGGVERDGKIYWSQPEILLFDDTHNTRFSYPDLIEQNGRYWVTETQKSIARFHEIDSTLLEGLWAQGSAKVLVTKGIVLNKSDDQLLLGKIDLPETGFDVYEHEGMSIDFWYEAPKQWNANEVLLDSRFGSDDDGPGILVTTNPDRAVTATLGDGETSLSWRSDPGLLTPGSHHIVAIFDVNGMIGSFVVDGIVCDGGKKGDFGWKRFKAVPADVRGSGIMKVGANIPSVRIYSRYLRTSEAVSNFNADKSFRLKKTAAVSVAAKRNPAFPIYHYMAPSGPWMGDVNAPIYHDGWFHVFYQWRAPDVPGIGWGHARSRDLVDWEFVGPLFIHPDSPDNACPNFFKVGDKWVLLMSRHRPHVEDWFVGTWGATRDGGDVGVVADHPIKEPAWVEYNFPEVRYDFATKSLSE